MWGSWAVTSFSISIGRASFSVARLQKGKQLPVCACSICVLQAYFFSSDNPLVWVVCFVCCPILPSNVRLSVNPLRTRRLVLQTFHFFIFHFQPVTLIMNHLGVKVSVGESHLGSYRVKFCAFSQGCLTHEAQLVEDKLLILLKSSTHKVSKTEHVLPKLCVFNVVSLHQRLKYKHVLLFLW